MIPDLLARAALGPVPRRYEGFWKQWQTMHPTWTVMTLTRPQMEVEHLPYSCPSQRADLIRWQHLFEHGGWWVCWDTQPLQPLTPLSDNDLVVGAYKDSVNGEFYALAVVGAVPGHPGVKAILDDLLAGNYTPNPISTGPLKATEHLQGRTDITVLPEHVFTPVRYGKPQPPPEADTRPTVSPPTIGATVGATRDANMPPRTRTRTVGKGHFRIVYEEGPLVRKQGYPPNIEHGTACNKAEALFWTQIRDTPDAIWFAPVVEAAPDYSWILQVKCGPYQGQDKTEALTVCERLGVWNVNSSANYGTLAGRLVIYDFAANPLLPWGPPDIG